MRGQGNVLLRYRRLVTNLVRLTATLLIIDRPDFFGALGCKERRQARARNYRSRGSTGTSSEPEQSQALAYELPFLLGQTAQGPEQAALFQCKPQHYFGRTTYGVAQS